MLIGGQRLSFSVGDGSITAMTPSTETPPVPIPASTVILVRDRGGQLQVYLLRRSSRSNFMPGNYVFPGGTVSPDDRDADFWNEYVDMDAGEVTSRFVQDSGGLGDEDALAHGIAAIRETFEEASLLLGRRTTEIGRDMAVVQEQHARGALPGTWLRELVLSGGWTLTLSALACWSHWITPEVRSRRYDTRFFVARMPEGQVCRPDHRETTHGIWVSPEEALSGNQRGTLPLSPPALTTLYELLSYPGVPALEKETAHRPWGEARVPRLVPVAEGVLLVLPWDPDYRNQDITANIKSLERHRAPIGRAFSRLWFNKGVWLPLIP